jgi:hypothetical protein
MAILKLSSSFVISGPRFKENQGSQALKAKEFGRKPTIEGRKIVPYVQA